MLTDDGLLLLLVLCACALTVLGTLDVLWPTRPRHRPRPPAAARAPWRRPAPAATISAPRAVPAAVAAPAGPSPEVPAAPVLAAVAAPDPPAEPVAAPIVPEPPTPAQDLSVVERGFALLEARRLPEAVALAHEAIQARKSGAPLVPTAAAAEESARLWGLLGLARQALDDFEGARFAFEEAIAVAPRSERPRWERHLVALILARARRALDLVATEAPADRIASLTSTVEWLERGLAISPDDGELRATVTAGREALWPAHEARVDDFTRRLEFAQARRALDEVLDDPECPPHYRLAFCRRLDWLNAGAQDPTIASDTRNLGPA